MTPQETKLLKDLERVISNGFDEANSNVVVDVELALFRIQGREDVVKHKNEISFTGNELSFDTVRSNSEFLVFDCIFGGYVSVIKMDGGLKVTYDAIFTQDLYFTFISQFRKQK